MAQNRPTARERRLRGADRLEALARVELNRELIDLALHMQPHGTRFDSLIELNHRNPIKGNPMANSRKKNETQKKSPQSPSNGQQYGEGNYTAAREYQRGATKTAQSGTEQAAKEARRAMDDPEEREQLEKAAEKAKRGQS